MKPDEQTAATVDGGTDGSGKRTAFKRREREIIDAAAEIFRRRGYAETSVQDIADSVGMLKGSLYYYIESKEDLLYRVLDEVHQSAKGIVEDVSEMQAPPLERLRTYIRRHVEYNTKHLTKIAVFYHDFNLLTDERRAEIVRHRKLYEDFVASLIRDAQEAGEVESALDARIAAYFILGGVNWIYTWFDPKGRLGSKELGEFFAERAIRGLTSAAGGRRSAKAPAGKRPRRARTDG